MSASGIEKGERWRQAISGQLGDTNFAIICLTPEALHSSWLLFEAGALSKDPEARTWTYLFDLAPTDVEDPLSEFQHTIANKDDTQSLVRVINSKLGDGRIDASRLDRAFERSWPDLERKLEVIKEPRSGAMPRKRSDRELLEEAVEHLRALPIQLRQLRPPKSLRELLRDFFRANSQGRWFHNAPNIRGWFARAGDPQFEPLSKYSSELINEECERMVREGELRQNHSGLFGL
jgi:hypothetical protein